MSGRSGDQSMIARLGGGRSAAVAAVVALCLAVSLAGVPTAMASHQDDPNFSVFVPDPTVQPGSTTQLTVQFENDARSSERTVVTADQVRATMSSGDTPIVVESGPRIIGSVADGQVASATFTIRVPRDVPAGEYTLPTELDYEFTEHANTKSRSVTVEPTVRVDDRARFAVVGTESDVSVGDTGTMNVTVENVGSAPAIGGTMTLTTRSSAVTIGGSESDARYVGRLAPGERRSVSYEVAISEGADPQSFALAATVDYEDTEGLPRESPSLAVQLTPRTEQEFIVRDVESTLRVGDEGTVRGQVVNQGPETARNAVAVISIDSPNLDPLETEYVLGTLEPGEAASFEYEMETSEAASAGPRQLSMEVRYRNSAGTQLSSESIDVSVEVAAERDVLDVRPTSTTVEAGGSSRLVLEVTNAGDEPITDVSAKLFANAPLSSSNDEAFQSALAPGETKEFVFQISGAPGSLPKTYPASVDFQYDDADGDTLLSDTYRIPVEVVEPEGGGGPPILLILVVLLVVLAGGYYLLRRTGRWPPWR